LHRQSGLGSLGRPRFTALAEWCGGKIAREAKALLPSAWLWAGGTAGDARIYYDECVRRVVRAHDPFQHTRGAWILRRLSPHCSRIRLSQVPRWRDEQKLLRTMGHELANVHLGTRGARANPDGFPSPQTEMAASVRRDNGRSDAGRLERMEKKTA
jgi:hypothetical protein